LRGWQILKIWGIPFKIHPNWFLLLLFFSWSISNQVNLAADNIYNLQESWLIGFLSALFLFCSIISSQIFHTFVCLTQGVKIRNITFFFLGAILQTEKDCQNALGNIKIALVRPLFCILTAVVLLLLSYLSETKEQILINIISRVGILNLFLGFLNLIPVGSLDGGVLVQSIIWHLSGNKNKARNFLNKSTLVFSILVLFTGVLILFNASVYYGILLSILGLFGINFAKSESQFLNIEKILQNSNISELKLIPLRRIEFDSNFKEFNRLVSSQNISSNKYYFVTKDGRWDGFLTDDNLKSVSIKKWDKTFVEEFRKPMSDLQSQNENTPVWKIIENIEKTNDGILLIVNSIGLPKGLIDRNRIGYFVLNKLGIDLSGDLMQKLKSKDKYPLGLQLPRIINLMKKKGDIK